MSSKKKAGKEKSDAVKSIIKKHLGKRAKGRQILAAFEEDPESNSAVLVNYIREQLPEDKYDALLEEIAEAVGGETSKTQINNIITGGKIEQLINIGRLDSLTIEKKISPFRDVKQLLVFLSIFLFVTGGIYAGYRYSMQPRIMKADFNIAIAQFEQITEDGRKPTALSTKISNSLLNYLDSEFRASDFGLDVDVSNKNMPPIRENAEAEKLADRVGATIVIYGDVYVQDGEAKLSPRFYVSQDFDASELTGETELAKPIIFNIATIDDQEKVEQDLKIRSAILANYTYSLIYLSDQNFKDAIIFIQRAIRTAETSTQPFAGQENLYLVAAHIDTAQKNYDIAHQWLDKAFEKNPNYARAYIARGNIYYGQATESEPYDEALLDQALAEYKIAYETKDQPPGAHIPVKAHRSMGNIFFLKAQNAHDDPDFFMSSIEHYKFVTEQYKASKAPAIRELAALSYFSMGIAYERTGNIQQAIQAYESAKETTADPKFKETVENQINVTKKSLEAP
jgi:tetratricopeptide (TPR) repeat protein